MVNAWERVLAQVQKIISDLHNLDCPDPFFRGHSDSAWTLLPSLARARSEFGEDSENRLYYRFIELGAHLIPQSANNWDALFLMQHHYLPTRLLDWTENFAVALYFALKGAESDAAIWVLNPYQLNKHSIRREVVVHLRTSFPKGYEQYFIRAQSRVYNRFPGRVVAAVGSPWSTRMRSQRAVFTLHRDLRTPLEKLYPDTLRKIVIPLSAVPQGRVFLRLSGVNEFSLFPDLDGLGRHLRESESSHDSLAHHGVLRKSSPHGS